MQLKDCGETGGEITFPGHSSSFFNLSHFPKGKEEALNRYFVLGMHGWTGPRLIHCKLDGHGRLSEVGRWEMGILSLVLILFRLFEIFDFSEMEKLLLLK